MTHQYDPVTNSLDIRQHRLTSPSTNGGMDGCRRLTISDLSSLALARETCDLDEVVIDADRLKYRRLLPCALKYAIWAVKQEGGVTIKAEGLLDPASPPFEVPFNNIRQWVVKFCRREAEIIAFDNGVIQLRRTSPILPPGWSAGVVFSGRDAEIPGLMACLTGLMLQPELSKASGGEIVVCGPSRDTAFLKAFPDVRYLRHETLSGPRFLISRKKNALIDALKGPRVVVLHLRIVLEQGALAAVPREFDISSPNTMVVENGQQVPYLSLCQSDSYWPGQMARRVDATMRSVHRDNPFALHERGPLFVDGGAFYVTKKLHDNCPLDDLIAWEEGEDVEWCARAFMHGYLIDLAPKSKAVSATSKLRPLPQLGIATIPAYVAYRNMRTILAKGRHAWSCAIGRR